jgi:hypothetical protein
MGAPVLGLNNIHEMMLKIFGKFWEIHRAIGIAMGAITTIDQFSVGDMVMANTGGFDITVRSTIKVCVQILFKAGRKTG